jgi:hypothetical protein
MRDDLQKVFHVFTGRSKRTVTINQVDINKTAQFVFDKHENLYTSAINYSYLSFPVNRILAIQPKDIGWNYSISTYTSHQTQLDYNLTNFFHIGGTQHMLWQTFIRNVFQP